MITRVEAGTDRVEISIKGKETTQLLVLDRKVPEGAVGGEKKFDRLVSLADRAVTCATS